jgi:pyruvate formate lyase activating enzyme
MREALFYEEIKDGALQCRLCPRECVIEDGKLGFCRTRKNEDGVLYTLIYGRISSIATDPIEKKPLYHYHPGTKILSIGSWGCNMSCPWCQNHEISQGTPQTQKVDPERLINIALDRGSPGIAYTYNEPMIWFEFVLDTSRMASANGLYNVLVTNGYISREPFKLLLQTVQAMNIDLKGFDQKFYKKRCSADLDVIKENIALSYQAGVHIELTTLLIPGENDTIESIELESQWIASIDPNIPLHLSLYFPAYRFNKPPSDIRNAVDLWKAAKKYLRYVYLGNQMEEMYQSTECPDCHYPLIGRKGYQTRIIGLDEGGKCQQCQRQIPIIL